MRRLFTTEQFVADGRTFTQLRSMTNAGLCVRVRRGVYAYGADDPSAFERSLAFMLAHEAPVWGPVAAQLQGFDGITVTEEFTRRHQGAPVDPTIVVVDGHACTGPLQTLLDIAPFVTDDQWEQALEFTLRNALVVLTELEALVPGLSKARTHGVHRIRRVLAARPIGAPPTASILETWFVQLARLVPGLPPPLRQYVVTTRDGLFVARVDFAWPELGIFIELDSRHHDDQQPYDASRQTRVATVTGWLCGRFRYRQVDRNPRWCARQLEQLVAQARARPVAHV
jgi:hypothetical protein